MRTSLPLRLTVALVLAAQALPRLPAVELLVDDTSAGPPVRWGADAKLTAGPWAASPHSEAVAQRIFVDGGFEVFRLPIYAHRTADDPLYSSIASLAATARRLNPRLTLFASVANGDGDRNNWLHGREKFPVSMLGGAGVHSLRHDVYAAAIGDYLDMMQRAGVAPDWLGVFNEDPARPDDYRAVLQTLSARHRVRTVGVETWALRQAILITPSIAPLVDIVGAHFYDDTESRRPIPPGEWTEAWRDVVRASTGKPVWFTEASDFRGFTQDGIGDLLDGLLRLLPAINGGVEGVILYQVVPRFVSIDNRVASTKWSGLQALIHSTRRGRRLTTSHDGPVGLQSLAVAAASGAIDLHLVNAETNPVTLIARRRGSGSAVRASSILRWDDHRDGAQQPISTEADASLTLPPRSYSVLQVPAPPGL